MVLTVILLVIFFVVLLGALVGWLVMLAAGILGVPLAFFSQALPLGIILAIVVRILIPTKN